MQKNIIVSIIASVILIGWTIYFISDKSASLEGETAESRNVEIKDGVQYVIITAEGGYSPSVTKIKGGLSTKLVVKTEGTYDCSASLVVHSVSFKKVLQPIGEEIIDLGIPKSGDKVQGVCGMGMYNFQIRVS